jgi:hypothetical protein
MRYAVNPMARLSGLGATSDQTTIDTASVLNVGDQLRQAQADLTNLLGAMQQNPQLAQAIGRDVIAQQQTLGDLISKYVYVYTAIFGNPPAGLGVAPIVVGIAIAGVFAVIITGLAVWWEKEAALKQQAQAVTIASQNQAALIAQAQAIQQQADAARASGDTATAASLDYRANQIFLQAVTPNTSGQVPPPKPASLFDWLQQNWITAALIVGAVIVIPKVAGEL